jgi:RA like domain/PH domain
MATSGNLWLASPASGKGKKVWAELTSDGLFWADKKGKKVSGQSGVSGCTCHMIDGKPFSFGLFASGTAPPAEPKVLLRANDREEMSRWMDAFRSVAGGGGGGQAAPRASISGVVTGNGGVGGAQSPMKVVRVYTKDGSYKSLASKPDTTVGTICQEFADKLRLGAHVQNFAIKEVSGTGIDGDYLDKSTLVYTVLSKWEANGYSNPVSDSDKYRFVFGFTEEVRRKQTIRLQQVQARRPAPPVPGRTMGGAPPNREHIPPAARGLARADSQLVGVGVSNTPPVGRPQIPQRPLGVGRQGAKPAGRPPPGAKPPAARRRPPAFPGRRGPPVAKRQTPARVGLGVGLGVGVGVGVGAPGPGPGRRGPPMPKRGGGGGAKPPVAARPQTAPPVVRAYGGGAPPVVGQSQPVAEPAVAGGGEVYGSLPGMPGGASSFASRPPPPAARPPPPNSEASSFYGSMQNPNSAGHDSNNNNNNNNNNNQYGATGDVSPVAVTPVAVPIIAADQMVQPISATTNITPIVAPDQMVQPISATTVVAPVGAADPFSAAPAADPYGFDAGTAADPYAAEAGVDEFSFEPSGEPGSFGYGESASDFGEPGDDFDNLVSDSFLKFASGSAAAPLPSETVGGSGDGEEGADEMMAFLASELDDLMGDIDDMGF